MIPKRKIAKVKIQKAGDARSRWVDDFVAIEEPLEIRVGFDAREMRAAASLSVTMRTPGNDYELAAGFLFSEGVIKSGAEIHEISYCVGEARQEYNVVTVELRPGVKVDAAKFARNTMTTASCGVCGKSSLEALKVAGVMPLADNDFAVSAETIRALPEKISSEQTAFEKTGGIHAAALFDSCGKLISLQEDIGRHNAVDKIIGEQILAQKLPLDQRILFISGRAGFEIVQKALLAKIPILAAVGAPSSLAVSLAQEFNLTLIGFLRGGRFNIYSGAERLV